MTIAAGMHPQPLPTGTSPGAIPGTEQPAVWGDTPIAALTVVDKGSRAPIRNGGITNPSVLVAAAPAMGNGSTKSTTPVWTNLGPDLTAALKGAAALSLQGSGPVDLGQLGGKMPMSPTIGLLQAADGAYYATGLQFSTQPVYSVIPAAGMDDRLKLAGKPLDYEFEKQAADLKALVWADRWIDFSDKAVGATASLAGA